MRLIPITALLMGIYFSACTTPQMDMDRNKRGLMTLVMGMSKAEVLTVMGEPTLYESYQNLNGKQVDILFYYTQRKIADYNRTKDECTPVVVENGKLIGFGDEFYETKKRIDVHHYNE
jgi:outer membrane protein assembly factor BamE (lipoprotein component of BamABCDE complex)